MNIRLRLRTGDRAILVGVAAIAAYEKLVNDDADLISNRVAAYRSNAAGRLVTDAAILVTALHLAEALPPEWDLFHTAVKWFRRSAAPPPQPYA